MSYKGEAMMHPKAPRRTKIIATLGPASNTMESLTPMIEAGVDLCRINFSHGNHTEQTQLIEIARQAADNAHKEIGIIADLQGPKIRVGRFEKAWVELVKDQDFILDCDKTTKGDASSVSVDYKNLFQDVQPGDTLLLDDGLIEFKVLKIDNKKIHCQVITPGRLSDNKGINKKGGGLSAGALTDKDLEDLKQAINAKVDYIAVSFTRNANDISITKQKIIEAGGSAGVIAKIERAEAIEHIDEIINASDAVMVARGDLGVEIGLAEVPFVQKHIINRARALDKAVITATQMMESMITQPQATRAEVSDVANAIIDGTDAVMFSAETAVGKYPVRVTQTVNEICLCAEKRPVTHRSRHRMNEQFDFKDEAIAMAVMYTANHYPVRAIISLTESGATPLWMSRIRSNIPIYALSRHIQTLRKITLYRGVYPVAFDTTQAVGAELRKKAIQCVKQQGLINDGDTVIITHGTQVGKEGGTDSMKVVEV